MPVFITTILSSLLSFLPGAIGDFFKKQGEIANAELEYKKQMLQAQILMAQEAAKAQLEYQTAALHATTPIFKQHMFWFLSIPIAMSVCLPHYAAIMWDNIRIIPDFYWSLYSAIVLTIWGIPVASSFLGSIFNRYSDYQGAKRADKIEMQRVSGEQYKLALFNEWRKTHGPLNQKEVDSLNQALDNLGGPGAPK